ncbi:LexA family transcriptional regulator [Sphingomonas bacterium]|uniref:S24 family peptidase n=1 Tax=Sphingomonas bacterium TaxID=1895847 RepID=UPI0020C6C009|nr:LexA family transcriptional regulator [Sphingomonas bacterium]
MALRAYATASGASLSALSRMLGRNVAYLQQYVSRGTPQRLPERERRLLADYLGVAESVLGAPAAAAVPSSTVSVPRLSIAASAGPGALVDREIMLGADAVDRRLLRQLGVAPDSAAMLRVRGTSMEPGLFDGDWVLIDTAVPAAARAGVHVVRIDDAVMVKRLTPGPGGFVLTSDNPAAPPVPMGKVAILGRVVWQMRATR